MCGYDKMNPISQVTSILVEFPLIFFSVGIALLFSIIKIGRCLPENIRSDDVGVKLLENAKVTFNFIYYSHCLCIGICPFYFFLPTYMCMLCLFLNKNEILPYIVFIVFCLVYFSILIYCKCENNWGNIEPF